MTHNMSSESNDGRTVRLQIPASNSDETTQLPSHKVTRQLALDKIVNKIGMGKFQKQLLMLCGLGWLSDNMWIQCVVVILPRVKVHYNVNEKFIGVLSSSMALGMMIGALFWGVLSDAYGRKKAFNFTLLFTALFGILSAFSQSFFQLCILLFLTGFSVGGNMPVDGALFLEFIPKTHQYLLTSLSVFFSFGAVLTSILAYLVLPQNSCIDSSGKTCNVEEQNNGWRYILGILGLLTFIMFICRILFFRLQESPKFLISQDHIHDAVVVLRKIAIINECHIQIKASDIQSTTINSNYTETISDDSSQFQVGFFSDPIQWFMLKFRPIEPLFSRKWIKTTILVWSIWTLVAFAYCMFNVFLPTYLEWLGLSGDEDTDGISLIREVLRDYVIYSVCGIPGSLFGSYLIETILGRKGSMALATFGTALAVFMFSTVSSRSGEVISSAMVSLLSTLNYAVIYGYTPEVFEVKLRGTACGMSSALGRIAGIIAPIVTGVLLSINICIPLYLSASLFALSGICMILLPIETRGRQA
ncbi:MFS general substrate transporter [Gigaspora margarita]|uniref:MFS general substrate transporter n=1 Tax=Gigaspora margarita TaxID=4874 RepID=A0A8H4EQZ0_GIGMA|nr:MFS general substrate transporter [Gigaspora margarita]